MKRLLTTLVILTGLIGSAGAVWADAESDFVKGWFAHMDGDFTEALKWYRKAAEQGDAEAQTYLGGMYESGEGVTQDSAEAVKWYRKAAEQGYATAQTYLGRHYNGEGVTQDYAEAVKWLRKAAEQGDEEAQNNLGWMYEKGNGVLQDRIAAHMWLNIATANGNKNAGENRDFTAGKLTAEQLEKANERAKRCMDADYKDCDAKAKSWWQKLKD
jgi:TPR repeat protein